MWFNYFWKWIANNGTLKFDLNIVTKLLKFKTDIIYIEHLLLVFFIQK